MKSVDALDQVTRFTRNEHSQALTRVGPDSFVFQWGYVMGVFGYTNDVAGDSVIVRIFPSGPNGLCDQEYPCLPSGQYRFRGAGEPQDTSEYVYTGNRLLHAIHPSGDTTTHSYGDSTDFSQLTGITSPLGEEVTYSYEDSTGHLKTQDRTGNTTTYWYDGKGRKTHQTLHPIIFKGTFEHGEVYTEWVYDELNRVIEVRRAKEESGGGGPTVHAVTYAYDDTARTMEVTDPKGQTQKFTYDALGRLIRRDARAPRLSTLREGPACGGAKLRRLLLVRPGPCLG